MLLFYKYSDSMVNNMHLCTEIHRISLRCNQRPKKLQLAIGSINPYGS